MPAIFSGLLNALQRPPKQPEASRGNLTRAMAGIKLALFVGFGGVLGLMALAGLDSIRALHQIQADDAQITRTYLTRHRLLEQIRSSLYLSSTYVRDYLLESNPEVARTSMAGLHSIRDKTTSTLREYSQLIPPDEKESFSELEVEIAGYWKTLEPVYRWTAEEKRSQGFQYLQTQVLPRRALMAGIADRIDSFNEQALANGDQRVAELFAGLRRRVLAILGLTLGMGSILAAASINNILRMERQGRLHYDEMQRAQDELKKLSARLVAVQEQERRAISRELHDQIGQSLNALRVDLGNLAAITPAANEEAHGFLATARSLADESIKALRNIALLLRPSMLDDLGLVAALGWQAREVSRRTGIRIDLVADDVPEELPEEHRTCVYRVVQEALHNASRHAEARKVRVAVRKERVELLLTVEDDGKGFDPELVRGLGLLGMAERVNHLGGAFEIRSRPGAGTLLTVSLPLAATCTHTSELTV
jgi:signal transduction histidine kinase